MHAESVLIKGSTRTKPLKGGIPRPVEVVLVSICFLITLPFLVLLALAVSLTSRGPAIFRQPRVGRRGKIFTLYKLRTMLCESEGMLITAADDARVTRVGKILRRTRLDMLPELWNIVKGDMSLVGPRPEVPRYVNLENSGWLQILEVRPGLTDPVTLRLRNEEEMLASVTIDRERFYLEQLQPYKVDGYLEYLRRRNWLTDVKVLWDTCLTLIYRPKAEILPIESSSENRSF